MDDPYRPLEARFGAALKRGEALARYTVARLGGPADALLVARSCEELVDAVSLAVQHDIPWLLLGGGANVLAADAGFRGLVVFNHAKGIGFEDEGRVVADSGTSLSTLARRCMSRGLAGLEWAVNVPGTLGGAVVNNAGAHGGDMASIVRWAEVFSPADGPHAERWPCEQLAYGYRRSVLKGTRRWVVLAASLVLEPDHDPAVLNARADALVAHRKRTQPPGASLGSIFKNPPGDYAGRLIEAAGLKGTAIGGVMISPVHANFIVNTGGGTAAEYRALIELAQTTVHARLGISLDLEIELIGAWGPAGAASPTNSEPTSNSSEPPRLDF